jgi:hypothetical protein
VLGSSLYLFDIRPAIAWRLYGHKGNTGHKFFLAKNPPVGALISYYLKSEPDEKTKVKISILDKDGKLIHQLDGPKEAGINRANWDLRYTAPAEPTEEQRRAIEQGFPAGPRGPRVEPGAYTVKISVGEMEASKPVRVEEDPRITVTPEERAARHQALMRLYDLHKAADGAEKIVTGLKTSLTAARESWKKPDVPKIPENIQKAAEALAKQVDELHDKFVAPHEPLGTAGPPLVYTPPPLPQRVGRLSSAIEGYTAAPTGQQSEQLEALAKLLDEAVGKVHKLVNEDLANLNKMINEAGVPHILPAPAQEARPHERR